MEATTIALTIPSEKIHELHPAISSFIRSNPAADLFLFVVGVLVGDWFAEYGKDVGEYVLVPEPMLLGTGLGYSTLFLAPHGRIFFEFPEEERDLATMFKLTFA